LLKIAGAAKTKPSARVVLPWRSKLAQLLAAFATLAMISVAAWYFFVGILH
jgi:hypothetical protein